MRVKILLKKEQEENLNSKSVQKMFKVIPMAHFCKFIREASVLYLPAVEKQIYLQSIFYFKNLPIVSQNVDIYTSGAFSPLVPQKSATGNNHLGDIATN